MKNLFIVNTPFHLLTVFILIKGRFNCDENYLVLIHPHGYKKWRDSSLLCYLSSTRCGWKNVFLLGNWLSSRDRARSYRQQVEEVRNTIGKVGVDTLYLGSDLDVQNQLLAGALNIDQFYRYEDGLYSYYNADRRKPITHRLFHQWRIHLLKWAAGITGKVSINTSATGDNPSGIGDFMYKPELLKRFSPQTYEIDDTMIEKALQNIAEQDFFNPVMQKNSILYLSQPLVEQKKITLKDELSILQGIQHQINGSGQLLYKPHPNDNADKLDYFFQNLPDMAIHNSVEPIELSFAYEENLKAVVSFQSSALMFSDKFTRRKIKTISLGHFYKEPLHPAYVEIMSQAGVFFPTDLVDVANYLSVK